MGDKRILVAFLDVTLLVLGSFVMMNVLLMQVLNPPVKAENNDTGIPGNIIAEIHWPGGDNDDDVDLWIQAPNTNPVGYTAKSGAVFNLLRDDTGLMYDKTGLNYENAFSRGIPEGEYIVNVHLYKGLPPVKVNVIIKYKKTREGVQTIYNGEVILEKVGQEITVVRFVINEKGYLIPSSVNSLQRSLRSASE